MPKRPHAIAPVCNWRPRQAVLADVLQLEQLIALSARVLQADHYSQDQIEAALGPVFAVDRQLIEDGTYFIVERDRHVVGCGGWSKRKSLFGQISCAQQDQLDPRCDAARIRAFFVHPAWARRGIGRSLMLASEAAVREAGFSSMELVATLTGEPLYASCGFRAVARFAIPIPGGLRMPVVQMVRQLIPRPASSR